MPLSLCLYFRPNLDSWHHQLSENVRFEGYLRPYGSVTAHLWTQEKLLRTDGWTDGGSIRGPSGPKNGHVSRRYAPFEINGFKQRLPDWYTYFFWVLPLWRGEKLVMLAGNMHFFVISQFKGYRYRYYLILIECSTRRKIYLELAFPVQSKGPPLRSRWCQSLKS